MITRTCTKCDMIFLATTEFFYKSKTGKYGLESKCKKCMNLESKNYRENNPDYQNNWINNNRDKVNLYSKEWEENNPIKVKVKNDNWRKNNPYHNKKWRKDNPDIVKGYKAKRRNLGSIFLFENPFPVYIQVDGHHISDGFMVYLPTSLHKSHLGKNHREELRPYIESIYNITYIIKERYK